MCSGLRYKVFVVVLFCHGQKNLKNFAVVEDTQKVQMDSFACE